MLSLVDVQRSSILNYISSTGGKDWKVLVVDEFSKKMIYSVVTEDEILDGNVSYIEKIDDRRHNDEHSNAVYIVTPIPYIVDCVLSDIHHRRYKTIFLLWTSPLDSQSRHKLQDADQHHLISQLRFMDIDFFPRESQLAILQEPFTLPKDPQGFHILYNPSCSSFITGHLRSISQKLVSLCVALGENPLIRYYRPNHLEYDAKFLSAHLAKFTQDGLDHYARAHPDFPPQSSRPRGVLFITDRAMDLYAPFLHEFTYQAMAHDLLQIEVNDKVTYKTTLNKGESAEKTEDREITENDDIWLRHRHNHMQNVAVALGEEFKQFRQRNETFEKTSGKARVEDVKDMMANLKKYTEGKDAYQLHLGMAEECMKIFSARKLIDISSLEQILASGFDEYGDKPRSCAEELIRLLDQDTTISTDRIRLLVLYDLFRSGLLRGDVKKLLAHSRLQQRDAEVIKNIGKLGVRSMKELQEVNTPGPKSTFQQKPPNAEGGPLDRYVPNLKLMLDSYFQGSLDTEAFPSTQPEGADPSQSVENLEAQSSLRSAKPTWTRSRPSQNASTRQRVIVFMAGGATYSELRSCYELTQSTTRDVYLSTTHMLTPDMFLHELARIRTDRREQVNQMLRRRNARAPAHLWQPEEKKPQNPQPTAPAPAPNQHNHTPSPRPQPQPPQQPQPQPGHGKHASPIDPKAAKAKDKTSSEKEKPKKEKKKHKHFFHF